MGDPTTAVAPPDLQSREAWLAGIGLFLIAIVAIFVVIWYGSNETSAAGILGATIPAIAAIVSAVIGVAMGSKSGTAAGKQAGKSAVAAAKAVVDGAHAYHAEALAASGGRTPHDDQVMESLDNTSKALDAILSSL